MNIDEKLHLYSKEKLIDIIEKLSVEYAIKNQQYEYLRHNKKDEIELQERIDKAIEYIEKHKFKLLMKYYSMEVNNLLDILKGSDEE